MPDDSDCGTQLRKDDPAALKDIILSIQTRARLMLQDAPTEVSPAAPPPSELSALASKLQGLAGRSTIADAGAGAGSAISLRVRFMLDLIGDLKNNKRRRHVDVVEALASLKKWLGSLSHRASCVFYDTYFDLARNSEHEVNVVWCFFYFLLNSQSCCRATAAHFVERSDGR